MTDQALIERNRRNSRWSTGPRSLLGKRIASQNARRHGLFCQEVLLPDEQPAIYQALRRSLYADLQPARGIESILVDRIAATTWRLRRVHQIESGLLQAYRNYQGAERHIAVAFAHDASQLDCFSRLARYEAHLERILHRAMHELQRWRSARLGMASSAVAIDVDMVGIAPDQILGPDSTHG